VSKRPGKDFASSSGRTPPDQGAGSSRVDTLPDDFVRLLQPGQLDIGDVVAGRFKLVEKLGDGAMGQVFVAENLAIGRRVAVKLLKREVLADATFRQRFQQEAEAIASIEHRNVARFLDLVVGDPTFLVMEYVRGPTLDDLLEQEGRLTPLRAAALTRRLCWGLEAAHSAGVIHRDIKPSNVIVAQDLESGEEPKLIDFGLAKLANVTVNAGLTRTGQIVGTPEYMAPEQIQGGAVDARSDVYELGCLLYELLTGRPPFAGDDDVQVLYQQLHNAPAPLSRFQPAAPASLQVVIDKALKKAPDERYQSMKEMAQALAAVENEETAPRPIGLSGSQPAIPLPPPARSRVWMALTAVAVAALGGIALGRWTMKPGTGTTSLLLLSTPSGASVEVDGQPTPEATPTTVRGLLPGAHTVRMKKGDKSMIERQVTLGEAERAVINVVLPPASHPVEVHSVPEGAQVFLDGKLVVGETPTVVEITDDDFHELRVEKTGFEVSTRGLTPDDTAKTLTVPLQPERLARGTLMVDSNSASSVWIDGVDTGYTTPTLGIFVPVGTHTVEVRDGAGGAVSAKIKVAQGQTLRLLLTPKAGP
jgi:serine/threonine protein kinase